MKQLNIREIQLEEVEILKKFIKFANENNLKYYLSGGTMIGAVRHQGFIPWDDDIDIAMPRPDYDRLINLAKTKKISEELEIKSLELGNLAYPFVKIINKNIDIVSKSAEDKNLWIDIFPTDAVPSDYEEQKKLIKKVMNYKGIIYLHNTKAKDILKEKKSKKNKLMKLILKPIASIISPKYISKKIIKLAKSNDYNNSSKLGTYVWGYGMREILDRKCFEGEAKVKFEDIEAAVIIGYKDYLTSVYGDYMKLPPEEERVQHDIVAYKK